MTNIKNCGRILPAPPPQYQQVPPQSLSGAVPPPPPPPPSALPSGGYKVNNVLNNDYKLGIIRYAENYDKYFKAMYKDAADTMLELYNSHRIFFDYTMMKNEAVKINNGFYASWAEKVIYPYPVLQDYMVKIDKAIEDIEKYKVSNPDLYDVVKSRIELEAVSYLYMILDIHASKAIPSASRKYP